MNQILFFKEEGLGSSMNKIVRFFAVSMILFGLIIDTAKNLTILFIHIFFN